MYPINTISVTGVEKNFIIKLWERVPFHPSSSLFLRQGNDVFRVFCLTYCSREEEIGDQLKTSDKIILLLVQETKDSSNL